MVADSPFLLDHLAALGGTREEVAESLRKLGIRGVPDEPSCCPVANYLLSKGHLDVSVDGTAIVTAEYPNEIAAPDRVIRFGRRAGISYCAAIMAIRLLGRDAVPTLRALRFLEGPSHPSHGGADVWRYTIACSGCGHASQLSFKHAPKDDVERDQRRAQTEREVIPNGVCRHCGAT